jgi:hypothetical protein
MPKYIIEGNINFYDELYKSLDDKNDNKCEKTETCLITNAPLKENYITLGCNHKFNYDAIYNDIFCHKKKYNNMERCSVKQKELRCPYCRTIHNGLLPFVKGYPKVHGVNFYDEHNDVCKHNYNYLEYSKGVCCYVPPTSNTTDDIFDSPPKCINSYVKMFQLDGKTYCNSHYRIKTKQVYNEQKLKEKNEKKQLVVIEKQKIKHEKVKAKLEEKMKKQAEKLALKSSKIKNENVIISSSEHIQVDSTKCIQILKTGVNKGKQCGCKIIQNGLCGRHYKLQNNNVLTNEK